MAHLHAEPSFNNEGPLGTSSLHRRHRHLHRALRRPVQRQGREIDVSQVDVSMNGIELRTASSSPPSARAASQRSVAQVLPCYEVLHRLEQQLS